MSLKSSMFHFTQYLDKFAQSPHTRVPMRATQLKEFSELFSELRELYRKYHMWAENLKGPVSVSIDVTYRCNYNCPYCYVGCSSNLNRHELTTNEIINIIDELAELDVLVLCLCGGNQLSAKIFLNL